MKKEFVEPKLKRIELNMKENIASSLQFNMGYYFTYTLFSCEIVDTGQKVVEDQVSEDEAASCMISPRAKIGGGVIVPAEEVRPHFRW